MRGYMRKKSKDSWQISVSAGFDPVTGKRRQIWRTVRGTKKNAEQELTRLLREVDKGTSADPGRITLGEYLERWLEHMRTRVRSRTLERYAEIVRGHLAPSLGNVPLAKLHPLHIQALYDRLLSSGRLRTEGGLSPRTVLHIHRVLSEALRQAVRWQLLSANPAEAVRPPRPGRPDLTVVDPDLAWRILEVSRETSLEVPICIAIGTGMRRGEILALRWSDVALDEGVAYVRRTLLETSEGLRFEEPKTERSRRSVTLPQFLITALRAQRKDQAERRLLLGEAWQDHDLVLDVGDGSPMHPNLVSQGFTRLAKKHGFDGVRFHDLRHAHATLMLVRGVHPKVVSERLGHAGIAITLDTYSHVIPTLQAEAAAVLDEAFPVTSG